MVTGSTSDLFDVFCSGSMRIVNFNCIRFGEEAEVSLIFRLGFKVVRLSFVLKRKSEIYGYVLLSFSEVMQAPVSMEIAGTSISESEREGPGNCQWGLVLVLVDLGKSGLGLHVLGGHVQDFFLQTIEESHISVVTKVLIRSLFSSGLQSKRLAVPEEVGGQSLESSIFFVKNLRKSLELFGSFFRGLDWWFSHNGVITLIVRIRNWELPYSQDLEMSIIEDMGMININLSISLLIWAASLEGTRNIIALMWYLGNHVEVQKGVEQAAEGKNPRNQDMVKGIAGGGKPPKHKVDK